MPDKIPTPDYDAAMKQFAKVFQKAIKDSLAQPYPFAPGYAGTRGTFGVRNMTSRTGNLYKSVEVTYDSKDDAIVVSMLSYWQNVNDGRKPGKYVPIKPLMDWIRHKGFNKNKTTGKFQKFNIKGMAFAVSKNIKKFGIQKTEFYDKAFANFIEDYEKGPLKALGVDIQDFFAKVIDPTQNRTNK